MLLHCLLAAEIDHRRSRNIKAARSTLNCLSSVVACVNLALHARTCASSITFTSVPSTSDMTKRAHVSSATRFSSLNECR